MKKGTRKTFLKEALHPVPNRFASGAFRCDFLCDFHAQGWCRESVVLACSNRYHNNSGLCKKCAHEAQPCLLGSPAPTQRLCGLMFSFFDQCLGYFECQMLIHFQGFWDCFCMSCNLSLPLEQNCHGLHSWMRVPRWAMFSIEISQNLSRVRFPSLPGNGQPSGSCRPLLTFVDQMVPQTTEETCPKPMSNYMGSWPSMDGTSSAQFAGRGASTHVYDAALSYMDADGKPLGINSDLDMVFGWFS